MDTSKLFLDAFANGDNRQGGEPIYKAVDSDTRTEYFKAAFPGEPTQLPTPSKKSWRLNTTKAARLDFTELMELDRLHAAEAHYSELPAWVIEGGFATPTQAEKQRQAQLEKETGYNTVERAQIFSAFNAEIGALAAMAEKESLRGSIFLDSYLESAWAKYGQSEVMDSLKSDYPRAAEYLVSHLEVKRAEAKAAEAMLKAETEQQDVAAEIKAAQAAIEAMNTEAE